MFRKGDRVRHIHAASLSKWGGFDGVGVLFEGGRSVKICTTDWLVLAESHDPFNQIVADYCRRELGHV